eukprot:SAG31_NODE_421_length_15868_cov_8.966453_4_plen_56_part_00
MLGNSYLAKLACESKVDDSFRDSPPASYDDKLQLLGGPPFKSPWTKTTKSWFRLR